MHPFAFAFAFAFALAACGTEEDGNGTYSSDADAGVDESQAEGNCRSVCVQIVEDVYRYDASWSANGANGPPYMWLPCCDCRRYAAQQIEDDICARPSGGGTRPAVDTTSESCPVCEGL